MYTSEKYKQKAKYKSCFSSYCQNVTENVTQDFVLSSTAGSDLVPNKTQEVVECSRLLSNLNLHSSNNDVIFYVYIIFFRFIKIHVLFFSQIFYGDIS